MSCIHLKILHSYDYIWFRSYIFYYLNSKEKTKEGNILFFVVYKMDDFLSRFRFVNMLKTQRIRIAFQMNLCS